MAHLISNRLARVLVSLTVALIVALAASTGIQSGFLSLRPLVELALCAVVAATLSLTVPYLRPGGFLPWKGLPRLQLRRFLTATRDALLVPRRLQFSVRAALIYLAVFCCWLGAKADRAHRCQASAAAIESAGGRVIYQSSMVFAEIRAVSIARRDAPADDATLLALFRHIRTLRPRRIVVGGRASAKVVAELQASFPESEVIVRGQVGTSATN
ncbi:MAG TPA: hypothetical protein VFI31_23150 [Pirellulales bacterium]|nr:hypothetical protein [Pirellulales bacterium]